MMRRCPPLQALVALVALALALASVGVAIARDDALPGTLAALLPEARMASAAIEADPRVLRAAGEREAGQARASGLRRGAHEWTAGGQWLDRRVAGEGRYDEWELSIERGLRSPRKASADQRTAEAEEAVGTALVAGVRREVAIDLLEAWIEWLAAADLERIAVGLVADAEADLDAISRRVDAGEAPLVARDGALSALAAARREARLASMRSEAARTTLAVRHPSLALPGGPPTLPEPIPPTAGWRHWADRVFEMDAGLELARGRAELAARRAERAGLDRVADPTVGLRTLSERGGEETAVGVYVSVPLGPGPRQALAAEAHALANAADAEAEATRIEVRRRADLLAARAEALVDAWGLARDALAAQRDEAARYGRGRELGGVDAATWLAARRREREAAMAELEARAAAWQATARLLLDAGAVWPPG